MLPELGPLSGAGLRLGLTPIFSDETGPAIREAERVCLAIQRLFLFQLLLGVDEVMTRVEYLASAKSQQFPLIVFKMPSGCPRASFDVDQVFQVLLFVGVLVFNGRDAETRGMIGNQ